MCRTCALQALLIPVVSTIAFASPQKLMVQQNLPVLVLLKSLEKHARCYIGMTQKCCQAWLHLHVYFALLHTGPHRQ